jgi:2-dehydro-3-deoxyphosphogluconate aldolase/(4S)-4-hydroxy-2-oxoglutarate aldolase
LDCARGTTTVPQGTALSTNQEVFMARHSRLDVLARTLELGVVPIFTTPDAEAAVAVVDACAEAGTHVVEYTNRGEGAYEVFRGLAAHVRERQPDIILGAGTILDAPTAALFVAAGAEFIVGPTLSADVARLCNRRKIAYIPGCFSPTEISNAEELGCEVVKLFPQAAVDPAGFIRSHLGPCPWSLIMPTGVPWERERIEGYVRAGAAGVGVGPGLITPERLRDRDVAGLAAGLRETLAWVAGARG